MAWTPILDGETGVRAVAVVEAIEREVWDSVEHDPALQPESAPDQAASLAWGLAGIALLYGYLGQIRGNAEYGRRLQLAADRMIDIASRHQAREDLFGELVGVAWTLTHLYGAAPGDASEDIDTWLREIIADDQTDLDHDVGRGVSGIGMYFLERRSGNESLQRVFERLRAQAEISETEARWRTASYRHREDQAAVFPDGAYHLGVAHGSAGVIAFLARLFEAGIHPGEVRSLLERAVPAMLREERPEFPVIRFPSLVAPDGTARRSRLGWCYGDLGMAVALLATARRVGEPSWEAEAVRIALPLAELRGNEWTRANPFVCHGGAGIAHLFSRLYVATGDEHFRDAALHWFTAILDGYPEKYAWIPEPEFTGTVVGIDPALGFLNGRAGVALTLLSAIHPIEPRWDRLLMMDVPDRHDPS